jgi:uncharacterized protein
MGQFLRIAIVLFGVWLVLRIIRRTLQNKRDPSPPSSVPADMLRCDYCGIFVPRSEAVTTGGRSYCSGAHADADHKK